MEISWNFWENNLLKRIKSVPDTFVWYRVNFLSNSWGNFFFYHVTKAYCLPINGYGGFSAYIQCKSEDPLYCLWLILFLRVKMIAVTVSIFQGILFLLSCGKMWQCISCVYEIQIFVVLFFISQSKEFWCTYYKWCNKKYS